MRTIDDRYKSDPVFRQIADMMLSLIRELRTTPTEIREAAMYAQLRYEMEHPRPTYFSPELQAEIDRRKR